MKKNLLILFILIFTFSVHADPSCDLNNEINSFVENIFEPGCLEESDPKQRCGCLSTKQNQNFILTAINQNENVKQFQSDLKEERTKYFWKVYTQMTHGAALQKQILFQDAENQEDEKVVGCTPTELSKQFNEAVDSHMRKNRDKLYSAVEQVDSELSNCRAARKLDCTFFEKQKAAIEAELGMNKKDGKAQIVKSAELNNQISGSDIQLETAKNWYEADVTMTAAERGKKLQKVKCLIQMKQANDSGKIKEYNTACSEITGLLDEAELVKPNVFSFTLPKVPLASDSRPDAVICTKACQYVQEFSDEFEKDKEQAQSVMRRGVAGKAAVAGQIGAEAGKIAIADCKDKLCQTFEKTNNDVLNSLQQNFSQTENSCITYPEFLLRKGVPGKAFMEELAKLPDTKLLDALTIPTVIKTEADRERLKFLRSNPIVAKLSTKDDTKLAMAQALQKLAKVPGELNRARRMDDYLNFMKTTVKDLTKNVDYKSQQNLICKQMIDSYTAIQVATDLPLPKPKDGELSLSTAVRECNVFLNNAVSQTAGEEALKMNDLFRNVEDLTDNPEPEISDAEAFKRMNKKYCDGYARYKESCTGDEEKCRKDFLSKGPEGRAEQKVIEKWNATTDPRKINFSKVVNESRESNQDTDFKRWWDRKVGSKLRRSPFPYKGEEAEYKYDKASDKSTMANTHVPEQFKNRISNSEVDQNSFAPVSSQVAKEAVNPGQVVPSFATPAPAFDPGKLSPGQSVTKAITNYPSLSPAEKIEGLKDAQEYLSKNKGKLSDDDLKEKLAETKEKIAEEKVHQRELEEKMQHHSPSHPVGGAKFSTATHQTNLNAGKPVTGVSPTSVGAKSATISKTSTAANAVNDALKSKEEASGRSVASLKESDLQVKSGTLKPEELTGKLEITKELTPATSELFLQMSRDPQALETYLAANLDRKEIGNGKIISILNPGTDSPVHHMIFKISVVGGKYIIQSMPMDVKVSRASTLKNLNMNIKQIAKPKKAI